MLLRYWLIYNMLTKQGGVANHLAFWLILERQSLFGNGVLIENMPVMTADQVWQKLSLPLDVRLIR